MNYRDRHIEHTVKKAMDSFPCVLVTGPRQVGKTTLLRHLSGDAYGYITLDDPLQQLSAQEEPGNFFKHHMPPLIVDEVQYAPQLFPYIKMIADSSMEEGQFLLSGSQQYQMMKHVSESLAGRIAILDLLGFSMRELTCSAFYEPFVPTPEYIQSRRDSAKPMTYNAVFKLIHDGGLPGLYKNDTSMDNWSLFYSSYIKTYIERDVHQLINIKDELAFLKFISVAAAWTGQVINKAHMANAVGVTAKTIDLWLSVLVASNLVYLLKPYTTNISKRALKTPKLYFLDTGLAAFLVKWLTPETLSHGKEAGTFFETFVVSEILKSYYNVGITDPPLYYYRDRDGREIDLLIDQNGLLYPVEIKTSSNPKSSDLRCFSVLDTIAPGRRGSGGIVCMYDDILPLGGKDFSIPVWYI